MTGSLRVANHPTLPKIEGLVGTYEGFSTNARKVLGKPGRGALGSFTFEKTFIKNSSQGNQSLPVSPTFQQNMVFQHRNECDLGVLLRCSGVRTWHWQCWGSGYRCGSGSNSVAQTTKATTSTNLVPFVNQPRTCFFLGWPSFSGLRWTGLETASSFVTQNVKKTRTQWSMFKKILISTTLL